MGAFAGCPELKQVTVVDEDIDVFDASAVEWTVATPFQAGRDLLVVEGARGSKSDPSTHGAVADKMGLDATVPLRGDPFRYAVAYVPGEDSAATHDWLEPTV